MLGRESALAFIIILYYIMEKNKKWEIKDRTYILSQGLKPLTLRLQSKSSPRRPLLWFDEEAGYQKELRYATNQKSPFI